jgi:hypothetical protein
MRGFERATASPAKFVVLLVLAACGSSSGDGSKSAPVPSELADYCAKRSSCIGGNDRDTNACVADAEGDRGVAEAYGCGTAHKTYTDCKNANSTCQSGSYTSGTVCSAQSSATIACNKAASGYGGSGAGTGNGAVSGGTGEFAEHCNRFVNCRRGNDKDRDACIASSDGSKAEASAYGCSDAFAAVVSCETSNATCQNGSYTSGMACNAQKQAASLCECQASYRGAQGKCGGTGGSGGGAGAAGTGGSAGGTAMSCSQCMSSCLGAGQPQSACSAACVPPNCA